MSNIVVVYFLKGCNMKQTGNTTKTEEKGKSTTMTEPKKWIIRVDANEDARYVIVIKFSVRVLSTHFRHAILFQTLEFKNFFSLFSFSGIPSKFVTYWIEVKRESEPGETMNSMMKEHKRNDEWRWVLLIKLKLEII